MDNNKSLLNEATIRRFMKLATLNPLSDDFVSRITEAEEAEPVTEEEHAEEEEAVTEEEATEESLEEGGMGMVYNDDDEMPEDEAPMEPPMEDVLEEPAEGGLDAASKSMVEDALEAALGNMASDLGDKLGLEISVEGGEDDLGGEEDVADLGLGGPEPEEMDMELAEQKIVEAVVARVAARLKNRVQKERIAEALTEKIFQRLTKK